MLRGIKVFFKFGTNLLLDLDAEKALEAGTERVGGKQALHIDDGTIAGCIVQYVTHVVRVPRKHHMHRSERAGFEQVRQGFPKENNREMIAT